MRASTTHRPIEALVRDLNHAREGEEHVGATHRRGCPSITNGHCRVIGTVREGGPSWSPRSPEIRGFTEPREVGSRLPIQCLRCSALGGKAREVTGRTPCPHACLPDWIPMTLWDHESVGVVLAACIRSTAGPPLRTVLGVRSHAQSAVAGLRMAPGSGGLPRYRAGHSPLTWGAYQGRGPLYQAEPGSAPR